MRFSVLLSRQNSGTVPSSEVKSPSCCHYKFTSRGIRKSATRVAGLTWSDSHMLVSRSDALIKWTVVLPSLMISYLCSFKQNRLFSVRCGSPFFRKILKSRSQPDTYAGKLRPLLVRWHYSPMRTFAFLKDFSQSALFFWLPFPIFKFACINICSYIVTRLFSCSPLSQLCFGSL